MEKEIEKWKGAANSSATKNLNLSAEMREKDAKIAEYETILKPIRPEDEERLAPWGQQLDNVRRWHKHAYGDDLPEAALYYNK